ncbi:AAA family ATPase [Carnobacterium mobile]|uniref:AAA family ATPase n=1 Tax=Carnobacterium mobile TaxID=2750 RepID=UPI00055502A8|nr:AAA family ATPase [Carnobacterium mobile]
MKRIELNNMKIRNFRGFKEFEFKVDGQNLAVFGENGTRKTSLFDAFMWAIFGKNSQYLSDFKFMPLDENNEPIEHLETEVILELAVSGNPITFSRMAKVGAGKAKGYTSTYRVDGVKMLQKDYNKKIAEIIDEETFKQITSIYYVAEKMDKKARRALLFDLVVDLSDMEVIESKDELAPLIEILGNYSVDDKRALLMEERPKNKQEQKEVDVRIDEADRNVIDLSNLDRETLKTDKAKAEKEIDQLQAKISSIKNGSAVVTKQADIKTLQAELETLRSQHLAKQNGKIDGLQITKQNLFEKAMDAQNAFLAKENEAKRNPKEKELKESELAIKAKKEEIAATEKTISDLRESYMVIASEVFLEFDEHATSCQYCGQDYPEDKKETIKKNYEQEKMAFNTNKATELEGINEKGKELTAKLASVKKELDELNSHKDQLEKESIQLKEEMKKEVSELELKRDEAKKEYEQIQQTVKELQSKAAPFEETKEYTEGTAMVNAVQEEINSMNKSYQSGVDDLQAKITELKSAINQINGDLYQFVLAAKQEERKNELIEQQKALAVRGGQIEYQIGLLNDFVKAKVSLLTDKINAEFKLVTFKLFEIKNNGSLEEACDPLLHGINFSDASNGERMEAGLDIINTLTRLKGVSAPVFIDNAEGLTKELDVNFQLIKLNAVKGQKTLKIEEEK